MKTILNVIAAALLAMGITAVSYAAPSAGSDKLWSIIEHIVGDTYVATLSRSNGSLSIDAGGTRILTPTALVDRGWSSKTPFKKKTISMKASLTVDEEGNQVVQIERRWQRITTGEEDPRGEGFELKALMTYTFFPEKIQVDYEAEPTAVLTNQNPIFVCWRIDEGDFDPLGQYAYQRVKQKAQDSKTISGKLNNLEEDAADNHGNPGHVSFLELHTRSGQKIRYEFDPQARVSHVAKNTLRFQYDLFPRDGNNGFRVPIGTRDRCSLTIGIGQPAPQIGPIGNPNHPWKTMSKEDFRAAIRGRCPIIWQVNPNDPSYDTLVREKAASGALAVISPSFLGRERWYDMEGGSVESWHNYYRGTDRDTLGWRIFEPPVKVPQKDFPIRYKRTFTDEQLQRIAADGIFLYSYGSGIEGESVEIAKKCREALGDRFIVMHRLEATNRLFGDIVKRARDKGYDPRTVSRKQLFELAKEYAIRRGSGTPIGFGFGASQLNLMQVVDILNMERWDMELANGPRQVELAFCRGVKKQYDVPFLAYIACMNMSPDGLWGLYMPKDSPYEHFFRFAYAGGGKPPHLLNRTFWVTWFSDADSIVGESTHHWCFVKGKDENHFELSDLGKKLKKVYKFADTDFFDRGDLYSPAAILIDYQSGWNNPTFGGFSSRKIWGFKEYGRDEDMIDNFFGAVFPGYETCVRWGSPYGDLVQSPYGDSFDVLLSNADAETLKKYKAVFLVGHNDMEGDLTDKLKEYVKSGGNLVLDVASLTDEWKEFCGIGMTPQSNRWYSGPGLLQQANSSVWKDGRTFDEKTFYYYLVESMPRTAEILARAPRRNHPLIVRCPVAKGTVYYVAIPRMQEASAIYPPYGMTECCKELIRNVLAPYQKVFVDGDPVQYIVRTKGDELLVMAVNNKPGDWTGKLTLIPLKKAKSYRLREWYENGAPVDVEHETNEDRVTFSETIPGYSLKLYTLK